MKRNKGSISLFIAMIFMLMVSLISMSIRSARLQGVHALMASGASMALDSLFASYDNQLLSSFGVLLYDGSRGTDYIESKLTEYLSYTTDTSKGLAITGANDVYGINLEGTSVTRIIKATDAGGLIWQDMVVDYEKYAKPIDMAADYLNLEETQNKADKVEEVNNNIIQCTEKVLDINENIKTLMELVDGVKCGNKGINFNNIKISDKFIKKFYAGNSTMEEMGIVNEAVFDEMDIRCLYTAEVFDDMYYYLNHKKYSDAKKNKDILLSTARECEGLIGEALEVTDKIKEQKQDIAEDVSDIETKMASYTGTFDGEVEKGILEELDTLKNYDNVLSQEICDVSGMERVLTNNKDIINQVINRLEILDVSKRTDESLDEIKEIELLASKYKAESMVIQYDKFVESQDESGILDTISQTMEDGILTFVLPDGQKASNKSIYDINRLTSDVCDTEDTKEWQKDSSALNVTGKKIVYTEYVMDNFESYTDKNTDGMLDYQIEYILYGKQSDKSNLKNTVIELATLRSGINMMYIITDSEKKELAYTAAAGLVGFTGVEPLVRLLQYTLLYLWSYAEGMSDVKTLLSGKKIPVIKNKDNWKLSLDNLFDYNIEANDKSEKGLDYEAYLRFLLFLKDDGEKSVRTMDLIELHMIQKGNNQFRMYNYIYGMETDTVYKLKGIEREYTQNSVYTY